MIKSVSLTSSFFMFFERFIILLYDKSSANEGRLDMFCKKNVWGTCRLLPRYSKLAFLLFSCFWKDVLQQHVSQACYQSNIWKKIKVWGNLPNLPGTLCNVVSIFVSSYFWKDALLQHVRRASYQNMDRKPPPLNSKHSCTIWVGID